MDLYLDSAYVAKCYLNEPDSEGVRQLAQSAGSLFSSAWCIPEIACTLHRHVREKSLRRAQAESVWHLFRRHVSSGAWTLIPVSEAFLYEVGRILPDLPPKVFLRAGDAVHLIAARQGGFSEIWSSDRHVLGAAPHFGLSGKSV